MGEETAELWGLLHVGLIACASVSLNNMCSDIINKFPSLFNGVGLLKNYELNLHIDTAVKPVAQPVRKIPFQLREKVERQLQELIEADIMKEVPEGASSWISPLVVIPKQDGDVHLIICVSTCAESMKQSSENVIPF